MNIEELNPRNEVERAYIQARFMSSLHSWKKGNSDLTAQHYGIATAKYLAMTRQQVIDGAESEALQTLKSIWNYQTYFSPADKLSVVKIICHIVSDQELVDLNVSIGDKVRKKFLDIAGTLAGQLKNDKVAQVQALSLIKKTTNTDVIAEDSINVQLRSIERAIKNLTVKLDREGAIASVEERKNVEERRKRVNEILDQATNAPTDSRMFLIFKHFALYLIEKNHLAEAEEVCKYLLTYAQHLSTRRIARPANESVAAVFKNAHLSSQEYNDSLRETLTEEINRNLVKSGDPYKFEELPRWAKTHVGTTDTVRSVKLESQLSDDIIIDLLVAQSLNAISDYLFAREFPELACALTKQALQSKIYARFLDQRDIEDLAILALCATTSTNYSDATKQFRDLRDILQCFEYDSVWHKRCETFADFLQRLFTKIDDPKSKLDVEDFATINYILIFSTRLKNSQTEMLLERLLELLATKVEPACVPDVFEMFWKDTNRLPITKYYECYILPLLKLTEQKLDPDKANDCYLDFCETLSQQEDAQKNFVPFLSEIVSTRDPKNESTFALMVAILSITAQIQLRKGSSEQSLALIDQIIELAELNKNVITSEAMALQLLLNLFRVEKVLLVIDKQGNAPILERARQLESEIANLLQRRIANDKQACFYLCDFLASLARDYITMPKSLLRCTDYFDDDDLSEALAKIAKCYFYEVRLQLIDGIIVDPEKDFDGKKSKRVIHLIAEKINILKEERSYRSFEDTVKALIELNEQLDEGPEQTVEGQESNLAIVKAHSHFLLQANYLKALLDRLAFDDAFKLTVKLITVEKRRLGKFEISVYFDVIKRLHDAHKFIESIDLLGTLTRKLSREDLTEDSIKIFDAVFFSAIEANEYRKALWLLNAAQSRLAENTLTSNDQMSEKNSFIHETADRFKTLPSIRKDKFRYCLRKGIQSLKSKNHKCPELELLAELFGDYEASNDDVGGSGQGTE